MTRFLARARVATLIAATIALIGAGAAAGAAGAALIIGQVNDGGSSQTVLLNAGTGASFTLKTTNVSTGASGIFGWSSSISANATRGVYGRADGANSYGVYARNNAASEGNGAGLYADGGLNMGVYATSADSNAIVGEATNCTVVFIFCGATGVYGTGYFFGAGVTGDGSNSFFGVYGFADSDTGGFGVYGAGADVAGSYGVYGTTTQGAGVGGSAPGAGTIDYDCGTPPCWEFPGGAFAGYIGVIGQTDGLGPNGNWSRGVLGIATGDGVYGVVSEGDARVNGNLSVTGTCTGCTAAFIAKNGSTQAIHQGDAVTVTGAAVGPDGSVVMVVAPAKKGDTVFGVADISMSNPETIQQKAISREDVRLNEGRKTVTTTARTVPNGERHWYEGGATSAAGGYLRVVTSGMLAYNGGTTTAAAGEALAVSDTAGKLGKASADAGKGTIAGTYVGKLADGRLVIFVQPH